MISEAAVWTCSAPAVLLKIWHLCLFLKEVTMTGWPDIFLKKHAYPTSFESHQTTVHE